MSASFTNQMIAQIELWESRGKDKYKNDVYVLPKALDEERRAPASRQARREADQADRRSRPSTSAFRSEGPYKAENYRY